MDNLETEGFEFDEPSSGRFLILSDAQQQYPEGTLTVVKVEKRQKGEGRVYPVLHLKAEDGGVYQCCAFTRDVAACIKQYGKNPANWRGVKFQKSKDGARREIVPSEPLEVQDIQQ